MSAGFIRAASSLSLFLMCASIDYYYSKVNLTGIYILPITIAGFAFYSTIWIRIFLAGVSTYTRYKLAPYSSPGAGIFLLFNG